MTQSKIHIKKYSSVCYEFRANDLLKVLKIPGTFDWSEVSVDDGGNKTVRLLVKQDIHEKLD